MREKERQQQTNTASPPGGYSAWVPFACRGGAQRSRMVKIIYSK